MPAASCPQPMPLTDLAIRRAKPASKPVRLFDSGGLYLEVVPAGGKWWRLKYRLAGKEKRIGLGVFPAVGLKEARAARDRARKLIAAGLDPSAERRAEKQARIAQSERSLESVSRAWLKHRAPAWTPKTLATITASLENHVFPSLGARQIADLQPAEIRNVVKSVEAAGAAEVAGRVFQRLRSVYRYAIAHDLASLDPTYPLKPAEIFKPRQTRHRASLPASALPDFLRALSIYEGDERTKCALELLILTAVRPGELRGMGWDELELENALWRIPAPRMKMRRQHIVPLSNDALRWLEATRAFNGGTGLVFPSPFYPGKPLSDGTLNSALARLGYKGQTTAHGFRTLFSTCANEAGWNADAIERQLAHEEHNETRATYNRAQLLDERRRLMDWWALTVRRWREQGAARS